MGLNYTQQLNINPLQLFKQFSTTFKLLFKKQIIWETHRL
jgi:hypothetical protein